MSVFKEQELRKHINEGNFNNLYLIYGDEKYLVKLYADMLKERLLGKEPPEFALHSFNFMNLDTGRFQAAVLSVPFMGSVNCVCAEDVNPDALSSADWNDFYRILENIPDSTTVIVSMPSTDADLSKSARFKKLAALCAKTGVCAQLDRRSEFALEKELVRWAQKLGSSLSSQNASKLIEYTTNDIQALQNEIRKPASFAGENEITLEMIDAMVAKNLQAKVFALADSVIDGKADKAFSDLDILFYQREKPTAILAVIANVYIDTYRMKAASQYGADIQRTAADFGYANRAFVLKKALARSAKISTQALRKSISAVIKTDCALKSTGADKKIALEKLIAQLLVVSADDKRGRV